MSLYQDNFFIKITIVPNVVVKTLNLVFCVKFHVSFSFDFNKISPKKFFQCSEILCFDMF
jgi:hypothetical protein